MIAVTLCVLPGAVARAGDEVPPLDEKKVEEALRNPGVVKDLIKKSPYDEKFSKAFRECAQVMFPPISPTVMGIPEEKYFMMDREKLAILRKCMSDKGYQKEDYGQNDPPSSDNTALDENYEAVKKSYERLNQAQKNIEKQRKMIAEHGMDAITPEMQEKFLVPLNRDDPSRVYKFNKDKNKDGHREDDSHENNDKQEKQNEK